jgi:hypothetical protein
VLSFPLGYEDPRQAPKRLESKPDPAWNADARVELDPGFVFELGTGSGRDGLDVTTLAGSGRGRHVWQVTEKGRASWRVSEFSVDDRVLGELVALLNELRILQQPKSTFAPDVHDGAQWILRIRTRERDKYIYASNAFPEALRRIGRFAIDRVNGRSDLLAKSRRFSLGQLHDRHLWRGWDHYDGSADPPHDKPWVCAVVDADAPLATGTRLRVRLADRTRPGIVDNAAAVIDSTSSSVCAAYRIPALDASHDYELEIDLIPPKGKQRSLKAPVATKGAPHVVVVGP